MSVEGSRLEESLEPATCRDCGTSVEVMQIMIAGHELTAHPTVCEPCGKKFWVDDAGKAKREAFEGSELNPWVLSRTWENYRVNELNEPAVILAHSVNFADGMGLVIMGEVGTGKSHLAAALANEAVSRGIRVSWVNTVDLLLRMEWEYRREEGHPWPLIEKYGAVPVLVLDDLGREKASESKRQLLYSILNRRKDNFLVTIATTNKTQLELEKEQIGEASVSRLWEMCKWTILTGGDRRLGK